MTIERRGDYFVDHDLDGLVSVGVESARLDGCLAEALRIGALGVFGAPCFGFAQADLDFLAKLPALRKIWFWDVALQNVDAIYCLTELRRFGVHPHRPSIDFNRLQSLEHVVWHHNPKDMGLASLLRLAALHVWHYNPRHRSFMGLEMPLTLRELQINWANPASLADLPALPQLKHLEIHRCRNLESIAELPRIAPRLEHLVVASCGRVADGRAVVKRLPSLRHAFVRDERLVSP